MDKFIEQLKNDPALGKAFVEHMHKEEARFAESFAVVKDSLNKQVMESIKSFADSQGIELKDSEEVQKLSAETCNAIAQQLNKIIVEQFQAKFKRA